jgi:hypothetical protein
MPRTTPKPKPAPSRSVQEPAPEPARTRTALTVTALAQSAGCSQPTIRRKIENGELASFLIGGQVFVPLAAGRKFSRDWRRMHPADRSSR